MHIGSQITTIDPFIEAVQKLSELYFEILKDAAAWKGKKVGYETMIPTRLTHKDIASLTGTSRQTITTILNELKEKNLIYFDRKKILIRDLDRLA